MHAHLPPIVPKPANFRGSCKNSQWKLNVEVPQNISLKNRTVFELLHIQNPKFTFFANVPKMPIN